MSEAIARGRGRPKRFDSKGVAFAKIVVSKYGLRKGQIKLAARGVNVSLPTLAKYITTDLDGTKPLKLRRGRPSPLGV
jgi:hypothetical protein